MQAEDFQEVIPGYTYKTPPFNGIIEREYCPTYVAKAVTEPKQNPNEVEAYKWIDWQEYLGQIDADGDDYSDVHAEDAPKWSWWCKDQSSHLRSSKKLQNFLAKTTS
jgi:isopentenyl-diphosphate delta-isomerase